MDTSWCPSCDRKLRAQPLDIRRRHLPLLQTSLATGLHDGILRTAIHALKYDNVTAVVPALGDRMILALRQCGLSFDMIIPVPLFTLRIKERGYNQSQVVGSYMAQFMAQPVVSTALERHRHTASQVGLSHDERQVNVRGAFHANPLLVSEATILLLDDVMTTGATLQECAHALLDAGANAVLSLTVTAALP
ncbi:MAG: ComF family protein [Anaerolineae bacterium]|nr:ComF family protein [Anaerolineae bacterium]